MTTTACWCERTESFGKTVPVKLFPLRRFPSSEDDVKALNPHRQRLVRLDLHGASTPFSCAVNKTQEKRLGMTDIASGLNKLHGNVCNLTHRPDPGDKLIPRQRRSDLCALSSSNFTKINKIYNKF